MLIIQIVEAIEGYILFFLCLGRIMGNTRELDNGAAPLSNGLG